MLNYDLSKFDSIPLINLWESDFNLLPEFVKSQRCIYCIENQVNKKRYVGLTSYFYDRFEPRLGSTFSHYNGYQYQLNHDTGLLIYRALVKYTPSNFIVYLLVKDSNNLQNDEMYWIRELHTCIYESKLYGYNMNYGGSDCSQLYSDSANETRKKTNLEYYGDPYGRIHEDWVFDSIKLTIAKNYGGDPYGQIHTEESRYNQLISNYNNHNGVLSLNTPEGIKNRSLSRKINNIIKWVNDELKESEFDELRFIKRLEYDHYWKKLILIFSELDEYRLDYRWSETLDKVFIRVYNWCLNTYPDWTKNNLKSPIK